MYYNYPVSSFYRNQFENTEKKNTLKVHGEGMVTAIPNQASATIGVITEGTDLTATQKQNSETTKGIIETLNSFHIPPKNIQTFDYQVTTEYDYENGKQIFRGYRVSNLIKVTINEVNQLGLIINRVIEAGANYVSNIQFSVSNPEYYYLQSLKKALKNAREKAKTIVTELKVSWDSTPIQIEEIGKEITPIQPQMTYVKGVSTEQFQPGTLQFTAVLIVKYNYS